MKNLHQLIKQGYINKNKHPEHEIFILNYTPKTQYEGFWNETTEQCRGLIINKDEEIISRCFRKFFNYQEIKQKADLLFEHKTPYKIYEKYDGSLGISYFIKEKPFIATRGSFSSDQSIIANKILQEKNIKLDPNLTYLFEIISPENKIVVNYGDKKELVLLAIIETKTNKELELEYYNPGFFSCDVYEQSIGEILNSKKENFEGYVVKFENNFRFKIKLPEYVRLHKIIFNLSTKEIWQNLKTNTELNLENIPDEIFNWIKKTEKEIKNNYSQTQKDCENLFKEIYCENRKEFAKKALENKYSSILFKMYDNKPYDEIIWEKIKPDQQTFN